MITVYPRVCGGTQSLIFGWIVGVGLSPRVRGNPSGPVDRAVELRSIPACAGEPSTAGNMLTR